jgi:hypothetical protein
MLICPDGKWEDNASGVPVCADCEATCLHCSGGLATECTKCAAGSRYLLSGTCHAPDSCPTGYFTDDNGGIPICKPCSDIEPRCETCHPSDGLTCTKCVNKLTTPFTGFLRNAGLTGATTTCYDTCPADNWYGLTNVCYACDASCK